MRKSGVSLDIKNFHKIGTVGTGLTISNRYETPALLERPFCCETSIGVPTFLGRSQKHVSKLEIVGTPTKV
ncbi:hypothetical protein JQK62_05950 [Leptospira santarosai]|nr:hypothetical protein [Leptospira santarosai]